MYDSDCVGRFETEVIHTRGNLVGMKLVHMDRDIMEHLYRVVANCVKDIES